MNVKLSDITLDARLQCRAVLDDKIVEEYSAVIADGGALPAVSIVRTPEGQLLLVDGWHRHAAYKKAGKKSIPADVVDGDFRAAQLAAVKANAHHGLRRSNGDKRRAVQVLLADPEWCGLSNREAAALAGVSHAYVGELRRHYGVSPGVVLDPEHQARVDGTILPQWKALVDGQPTYRRNRVHDLMAAAGPVELARLWPVESYESDLLPAAMLRANELATDAWPWSEDVSGANGLEERLRQRMARLDTEADIERALRSVLVPESELQALYVVLHHLGRLADQQHGLDELAEAWGDRPRLWARVQQRRAEVAELQRKMAEERAARPLRDVWDYVSALRAAKADPARQKKLLGQAPSDIWRYVGASELHPEVRDGAYREQKGSAGPCRIPGCGGWIIGADAEQGTCAWCHQSWTGWRQRVVKASATLDDALDLPGVAVALGGRVLDRADLELLGRILDAARTDREGLRRWLARGPVGVVEYGKDWLEAPVPTVVVEQDHPVVDDRPEGDDGQQDEDEDELNQEAS